ncbi:MAG: tRNA(Ile)-lysidine synthetase, partial [Mycobacterium sp.]
MDRPGAVAELRSTVAAFAKEYLPTADRWCVALSGGPDSLALIAVAAGLLPTTALIVDHGLQAGSAAVAATAQRQASELGCVEAQVFCVQVSG